MLTKYCKWCQQEKEIGLFHAHKQMKDGRLNKCAACVVKSVAEWRAKNPGARKEEHAKVREREGFRTREQYLSQKKANAAGKKATALKYARANKEKQMAWLRADRAANPEKYKARREAYRAKVLTESPDKFRAQKSKLQSKRRAAQLQRMPLWYDEFMTSGMYELCAVFRAVGLDMTVDHILPLQGKSVCGFHSHDNLQLMHKSLNSAKHNKLLDELTGY